jgi:prepilin peptidase CpaA
MIKLTLVMMLIACAYNDFSHMKIPNLLTGSLAILFSLWAVTVGLSTMDVLQHVGVGLAVFVGAAILFKFCLIGGGDVKLLAATGLWAGPALVIPHLTITSLLAGGLLIALILARTIYFSVLTAIQYSGVPPVPQVLQPGAGVPYGAAIAASAIILGLPVA